MEIPPDQSNVFARIFSVEISEFGSKLSLSSAGFVVYKIHHGDLLVFFKRRFHVGFVSFSIEIYARFDFNFWRPFAVWGCGPKKWHAPSDLHVTENSITSVSEHSQNLFGLGEI